MIEHHPSSSRWWRHCVLAVALCAGLAGCVTVPEGGGSDGLQELHLFVLPVAMSATQPGRPAGLAVRVFASSRARAKGLPIRAGTLEITAYDGVVPDAASPAIKPAQAWTFPAARLSAFAATSSLGTGYVLELPWQGPRPTAGRLAIVARLVPPRAGPELVTAPSVIPNNLR
jgi:hypothetical protein